MLVRLRVLFESFRDSLFFLPALFVLAAVAVAQGMLAVDNRISLDSVPTFLRFTVDSARELLSTVAGATITVTGVVFALTALSVQLASSQFSPRVVRGFLRDRFAQTAIGFMAATFTYSLVVLRAVRTPDGDASSVVPNLSSALALVLAVGVVIAILAYVDHTAQSLQATQLIGRITRSTVGLVAKRFPDLGEGEEQPPSPPAPATPGRRVDTPRSGWLQQVSESDLLDALPPGATVRVEVRVGSFVHAGRRLCTLWAEDQPGGEDPDKEIVKALAVGRVRTMQQDVAFGIRQLVDVALRALSAGVNDATTAYECIVHLGEVVFEILRRDLPPAVRHGEDGRCVLRPSEFTHDDYVGRAFDQIRTNAVSMPDLILRTLGSVATELEDRGLGDRIAPLARQARLVVAGATAQDALPEDLALVHQAAITAGFGPTQREGGVGR
ncbi:MAG TPA: DUF2254 domain-containing protein [Acidimicrobiales bacterium]|nr:DUF2254 domain-containing protein [Acidimicrobiales bacterium]